MVIPDGFAAGRPALTFWQWTTDKDGKTKVNCVQDVSQTDHVPAEGSLKFTIAGDYKLACTWDETTEQLAVRMSGGDGAQIQDVGPLTLAAHFQPHVE